MPTIPQQLLDIAERALKSGAKSGKECAAYTRKHAPDLAANHISHLFLAFKMVKRATQFAPAIEAAKAGKPGTLAQLAKPYQGASKAPSAAPAASRPIAKQPGHGAPYGSATGAVDPELAAALGLDKPARAPATPPSRRRRNDPAPVIAEQVYADFLERVTASVRKGRK